MFYYIAKFSDDHLIIGKETDIDSRIRAYDLGHPRATLTYPKARITKKQYLRLARGDAIDWLLLQGDPSKPMSDGKKELIARLAKQTRRNIP